MVGCQRTAGRQQFTASRSHGSERVPKSVNIFLGCFFLVNYFLGNGYLSLSYSFLYAGYLAAIPTLLLITFMSTITAMWEVEVMARAQVGLTLPRLSETKSVESPGTAYPIAILQQLKKM